MGASIVTNGSEGLVRAEQAVCATECLDDVFVFDHLVEVERVEPFGVEAREHLLHHDEQVNAGIAVGVDVDVGLLVRQTRRDVLFHGGPRGNGEFLAIGLVVVFYEFNQSVFFHRGARAVVDVRVEKGGHFHLGRTFLEGSVIVDCLGDGVCR